MRQACSSPARRFVLPGIIAASTAFVLSACAVPDVVAPLTARNLVVASNVDAPTGYVRVCKAGGPAGVYTFTVSVTGGGAHTLGWGPQTTLDFDGSTVVCKQVYTTSGEWAAGLVADVTVAELLPDGMTVTQIDVFDVNLPFPGFIETITNQNSVTVKVTPANRYKLNFVNGEAPPPPPGGFGCTPGYWKQFQHFDSWAATGLSPFQSVGSVFSSADLHGLGGASLVEGLSFKGGSTLLGAAGILLRAAIAAQLNARHADVGAPLAADAMVATVNAALASGSRDAMLSLASALDINNNLGCALN